ncbi:MAG: VWA domain-containing protein [Chitinophagales bacterium]
MQFIYTLIFSLLITTAFSEGMKISGTIKDEDSRQNIQNAIITISFYTGVDYTATTDSLGNYVIKTNVVVPEGDYTIQISADNYYTLNGFIHVTNNAHFSFRLKQKNPVVIKKERIVADTIIPILQGYATNNLVFLIDVSSSMNTPERMPLLKASLKYLVDELRSTDKITLLAFSKGVEEILSPTFVIDKTAIHKKIENLAFGSTTEGDIALKVAYKTALKNYIEKGNNRIILASDGLITSGKKDYQKIQETIEDGLKKDITLSIFCFGKPTDYVQSKLQTLAKAGNGNTATILNLEDGKLRMIEEAKAVKEQ